MDLLRRALSRGREGEALALVTVIRVGGSAPRHVGAKMLVTADGSIEATIGGGRVEKTVTEEAAAVARGEPARVVAHHLTRELAMCCGGNMAFYVEPVAPALDAIAEAVDRLDRRIPCLLVTSFEDRSKRVRDMPNPAITRPESDGERLIEPLLPAPRAIIVGCGHVARALGPMASLMGLEVVICDDDETGALASIAGAPWLARTVDSFDLRDIEAELGPLGVADHLLIMTRDHAIDQEVLAQALPRDSLGYLGLIGSRGKIGRFHKRLLARGVATDENWARLHAPIGLDIGAETPEEIAVSVLAELVQLRRRGRG